jgi:hypothetical protein
MSSWFWGSSAFALVHSQKRTFCSPLPADSNIKVYAGGLRLPTSSETLDRAPSSKTYWRWGEKEVGRRIFTNNQIGSSQALLH